MAKVGQLSNKLRRIGDGVFKRNKKQHIEHIGGRRDRQKTENFIVIKSDVLYLYFSFITILKNKKSQANNNY